MQEVELFIPKDGLELYLGDPLTMREWGQSRNNYLQQRQRREKNEGVLRVLPPVPLAEAGEKKLVGVAKA